jgi:CRISPR-associated protein Csy1
MSSKPERDSDTQNPVDLISSAPESQLRALLAGGDRLDPRVRAQAHQRLAFIHQSRGERSHALAELRAAVELAPADPRIANNLACELRVQGALDEAIVFFREAVRLDPAYARAWNNLGQALRAKADAEAAIAAFEQAAQADPKDFLSRYQLAVLLAARGRHELALRRLQEAQELDPGHVGNLRLLAQVAAEAGETSLAREAGARLLARVPGDLSANVGIELLLPLIPESTEAVFRARARYQEGLDKLEAFASAYRPPAQAVFDLSQANFRLAYQGQDDLLLQQRWGGIVAVLAERAAPALLTPIARRKTSGGRLRVGLVSAFLRAHTIGRYFGAWLTDLDRSRFEVVFYNASEETDSLVESFSASADLTRRLRPPAQAMAETLRADAADALIFTDIGMDFVTSALPALRLAPLQCVAWGHPVTTGLANADVFLSCATMEPPGAARHYSEELVCLPGIGTRYLLPTRSAPMPRAQFGLPEGRPLYVNPQSLFKIHPDNDELVCDLMEADPEAVLLFFQHFSPKVTQSFAARLQGRMKARGIPPRGQLKLLPFLSAESFRGLLAACDVMLDTLHWSGGNTSLDALSVGLPIVTLPGEFMRGRQTLGMLKAMGIPELVASSRRDYLDLAMAIAHDHARRSAIRERILAAQSLLFDRPEPIRALEAFLLERLA